MFPDYLRVGGLERSLSGLVEADSKKCQIKS